MAAAFTTSYTSTSTMSIAGPMMTAFTPPDHCANVFKSSCVLSTPSSYTSIGTSLSYSYGDPVTSCAYVERDLSCGSDGQATRDIACFPNNNGGGRSTLLFSPGIGCPGEWEMQSEVIVSSKTTAVCCPSGYREHSSYASCISTISYTDGTAPALSCASGGTSVIDPLTYSTYTSIYDMSTTTSIYSTTYPEYSTVWAQKILVAYPTTSASDGRVTPLGEPTSTNNPKGGSALPKPDDESGLGAGAIAGIVVGVVGALLLVGAFFFWRRRQQKHHHAPIPKSSPTGEHDALPEFVATSGTSTSPAQMTAANSNGLFQPQPELRSPR
ncbi:hypothetical protein GT037_002782 [Alternaria burnsii]|uniref:Epidermal growth factor receptor-like transmembrane-juxtamembrane segment domain-containing protein n=1 Tax=Alternaria burnsii TaxID=1187904 RepID=A0A8H7BC23_9PLEO|nr:uncharacterized protein GT037_002782 [Alternaria burnsii]KAF7679034.1 hypothetical protein GT037_002782 [Alternaria burnsii]CAI9631948.1 unnamed protein product [Alternaria burnsii]